MAITDASIVLCIALALDRLLKRTPDKQPKAVYVHMYACACESLLLTTGAHYGERITQCYGGNNLFVHIEHLTSGVYSIVLVGKCRTRHENLNN